MKKTAPSKFLLETLATGATNQLPISATCNAKCMFCSNNMNPFRIRKEGFRNIEDVKKGVKLLDPKAPRISLSDTLPGRMFEGEALMHPGLLTILKLIRKRAPKSIIQVTTNGTLLTEEFIKSLVPYQPMFFTISYHSDNPRFWCRTFGLGEDKYKIAHDSFFLLVKNNFFVNAIMVPLPKLFGYADIETTIKRLRFFLKQIYFLPPAYSKKVPPSKRPPLNVDLSEFTAFLNKMRKKYRISLQYPGDLTSPLDFYPQNIIKETFSDNRKKIAWLFSEAAYERANAILKQFNKLSPNEHRGFMVRNYAYGGNINCAGLLMVSDFRKVMKGIVSANKRAPYDLFVLPEIPFNRFGEDLMLEKYSKLESEFKTRVIAR